ncbi:ABC transporter substrate-binding protein [Brasilonema octagenarum UFV-E1]|uniref:ABC transporter substrate-binding protein n=2 Tax=Brasilonema TaxID=383614 RepID=A0A856MLN1_9CYAN|nr:MULTISPECIES: ABC transporter substrate-binding protein [Brasilonema]NMF64065.1 ABC transporter substrate-binding protein [Brasilonema octagenarum UFV-OR1]QDL11452.1 ABC transporter substrate-binding protein [Brasilonema sennae CENA114]QDL17842.1 ABC transporter substrate-binding protein [Brasilonema octagenarum UFV-E1]
MKSSIFKQLFQRSWIFTLLSLLVVVALNGCNPSQFKSQAAQVPRMITATLGAPSTFNSALNETAYGVFGFIYDSLINENPLTNKQEPALAESWEVFDNGKRIIITLREGLKWSDGQPMTADDVVFSYNEIYLNPKIPTPVKDSLKIGESGATPNVKKLDERRVEFTIPEPFAPFLRWVGGITILPAHVLQESVRTTGSDGNPKFFSMWGTDTDPKKIVGNGPYVMESYIPSQRVIFKRNPYYWRKDTQGKPQPYIERIVYQIIESTDNQLISFRSGQLDDLEVTPEGFSLLKREEKRVGFNIYNGGPDTGTSFIAFNLTKGKNPKGQPFVDPIKSRWFNKKEFRQAIAYAINREAMKINVFRGLGEPQNSFVYVKSPFYLPPEKGLKVYNYDPEKAKKLLLQAGFKYNSQNQLLDADGNRVRFTLLTNVERKTRADMAAQIRQDLANIGIHLDLQVLTFNAYIDKLKVSQNWDCYLGGFLGGGVEPHGASNIWRIKGASHAFNQGSQPGKPPIIGWEPSDWEKEIDRLYVKGAQELDENKRKEIYYEYQRIASEQLPFIHLVERLNLQAVRDRFQGIKYTALGGPFWNLYEIKVTEN